jgi:hypothetical protein
MRLLIAMTALRLLLIVGFACHQLAELPHRRFRRTHAAAGQIVT